jgi:N-acetylglutamate synthase-like GNAT family acetyltransferase
MVHPDFQSQGLGMELVRQAVKCLRSIGIQCVHATFNESEKEFFRKCGFHIFVAE